MWPDVIVVSLVAGVIALDKTAAFQVMISRPLAAAPLVGLILGDPATGAIIGALVELIWIGRPPLGGHIPPNDTLASIVVASAAVLAGRQVVAPDGLFIVFAFLTFSPLARLGGYLDGRVRWANNILARKALEEVTRERPRKLHRLNLTGMLYYFFYAAAFFLATIPLTTELFILLENILPARIIAALGLMFIFLPLVGVTAVLSSVNVKKVNLIFIVFFVGTVLYFGL